MNAREHALAASDLLSIADIDNLDSETVALAAAHALAAIALKATQADAEAFIQGLQAARAAQSGQ